MKGGEKIRSFKIKDKLHIVWEGKDNRNKLVGLGIYFIKIRTEKEVNVKKMIKLER